MIIICVIQLCVTSDPAIPSQSSSRPQCVVPVPTFTPASDHLIISLPALSFQFLVRLSIAFLTLPLYSCCSSGLEPITLSPSLAHPIVCFCWLPSSKPYFYYWSSKHHFIPPPCELGSWVQASYVRYGHRWIFDAHLEQQGWWFLHMNHLERLRCCRCTSLHLPFSHF